ncbi:hypothetical protein CH373_01380 [Leptospira perolatii]|uniref:Alpha/beta hydrolase n=1 Tax=Leptospira perolatii TaxID=2023191 RepID=A0A2M9ZRL6_9LEPT|nr:hypothetical protein [Leptospira perolatii]PJZ71193.1 hypothetical protein CH360_01380 [Leptospira perolatii]PJZ74726.1 hypothetical protein CH373_01380 [Leptospira perolatii]
MFIKKIPVKGELHGYRIETTVDDPTAKFYLEEYLVGKGEESLYAASIQKLESIHNGNVPNRDELKNISQEYSVDFATLFFANRLLMQDGNRILQEEFLRNLDKVRWGESIPMKTDVLIMLVPGYDYAKNGHVTGADFAKPRKLLEDAGYNVEFIDIDPLGGVEENAEYIAEKIRRVHGKRIAIAGASSGGPAIHLALGKLLSVNETTQVKAWLNLGGILQGSPLLDKFSSGLKGLLFSTILWLKGWERSKFETMRASTSRRRFTTLKLPGHIAVYNYLGLSLSGNVSRFGRDKYKMMRSDGPNDGLTLLPDIVAPNSLSILSPNTDHFFAEDPEIEQKTLALLLTIVKRM